MTAAIEAKSAEIRALKEVDGLGNKDPRVQAAVQELLALKAAAEDGGGGAGGGGGGGSDAAVGEGEGAGAVAGGGGPFRTLELAAAYPVAKTGVPQEGETRLKVKQILDSEPADVVGKEITIKGWVRTLRAQKTLAFVEVNDGSCRLGLQAVCEEEAMDTFAAIGASRARRHARACTCVDTRTRAGTHADARAPACVHTHACAL